MGARSAVSEPIATIVCERGLGPMPERVCVGRWKIANGKASGTTEARTLELRASDCAGCVHGEARASGQPAPKRVVLTSDQVKQRLLRRQASTEERKAAAPVEVPVEEPVEEPAAVEQHDEPVADLVATDDELDAVEREDDTTPTEEPPMREAICQVTSCAKTFKVKTPRGALPKRCPACKDEGAEAGTERTRPPRGGGITARAHDRRHALERRRADRARGRTHSAVRAPPCCRERAPERGLDRSARGGDRRAAGGELTA
jgi:hypothetical protein